MLLMMLGNVNTNLPLPNLSMGQYNGISVQDTWEEQERYSN